jgi:hypothetical protein
MEDRGYLLASPAEAQARFTESELPTLEELDVRQADLECDRAVKLTEGRSTWEREHAEQWLQEQSASLSEVLQRYESLGARLSDLESEQLLR